MLESGDLWFTGRIRNYFVIYVGALFGIGYFTALVLAYILKRKFPVVIPLSTPTENSDGKEYVVSILTSSWPNCYCPPFTKVFLSLKGVYQNTDHILLKKQKGSRQLLTRGSLDIFIITAKEELGDIHSLDIELNNEAMEISKWLPSKIEIRRLDTKEKWTCKEIPSLECAAASQLKRTIFVSKSIKPKLRYTDYLKNILTYHNWLFFITDVQSSGVYTLTVRTILLFFTEISLLFGNILGFITYHEDTLTFTLSLADLIGTSVAVCTATAIIIPLEIILRSIRPTFQKTYYRLPNNISTDSMDKLKESEFWGEGIHEESDTEIATLQNNVHTNKLHRKKAHHRRIPVVSTNPGVSSTNLSVGTKGNVKALTRRVEEQMVSDLKKGAPLAFTRRVGFSYLEPTVMYSNKSPNCNISPFDHEYIHQTGRELMFSEHFIPKNDQFESKICVKPQTIAYQSVSQTNELSTKNDVDVNSFWYEGRPSSDPLPDENTMIYKDECEWWEPGSNTSRKSIEQTRLQENDYNFSSIQTPEMMFKNAKGRDKEKLSGVDIKRLWLYGRDKPEPLPGEHMHIYTTPQDHWETSSSRTSLHSKQTLFSSINLSLNSLLSVDTLPTGNCETNYNYSSLPKSESTVSLKPSNSLQQANDEQPLHNDPESNQPLKPIHRKIGYVGKSLRSGAPIDMVIQSKEGHKLSEASGISSASVKDTPDTAQAEASFIVKNILQRSQSVDADNEYANKVYVEKDSKLPNECDQSNPAILKSALVNETSEHLNSELQTDTSKHLNRNNVTQLVAAPQRQGKPSIEPQCLTAENIRKKSIHTMPHKHYFKPNYDMENVKMPVWNPQRVTSPEDDLKNALSYGYCSELDLLDYYLSTEDYASDVNSIVSMSDVEISSENILNEEPNNKDKNLEIEQFNQGYRPFDTDTPIELSDSGAMDMVESPIGFTDIGFTPQRPTNPTIVDTPYSVPSETSEYLSEAVSIDISKEYEKEYPGKSFNFFQPILNPLEFPLSAEHSTHDLTYCPRMVSGETLQTFSEESKTSFNSLLVNRDHEQNEVGFSLPEIVIKSPALIKSEFDLTATSLNGLSLQEAPMTHSVLGFFSEEADPYLERTYSPIQFDSSEESLNTILKCEWNCNLKSILTQISLPLDDFIKEYVENVCINLNKLISQGHVDHILLSITSKWNEHLFGQLWHQVEVCFNDPSFIAEQHSSTSIKRGKNIPLLENLKDVIPFISTEDEESRSDWSGGVDDVPTCMCEDRRCKMLRILYNIISQTSTSLLNLTIQYLLKEPTNICLPIGSREYLRLCQLLTKHIIDKSRDIALLSSKPNSLDRCVENSKKQNEENCIILSSILTCKSVLESSKIYQYEFRLGKLANLLSMDVMKLAEQEVTEELKTDMCVRGLCDVAVQGAIVEVIVEYSDAVFICTEHLIKQKLISYTKQFVKDKPKLVLIGHGLKILALKWRVEGFNLSTEKTANLVEALISKHFHSSSFDLNIITNILQLRHVEHSIEMAVNTTVAKVNHFILKTVASIVQNNNYSVSDSIYASKPDILAEVINLYIDMASVYSYDELLKITWGIFEDLLVDKVSCLMADDAIQRAVYSITTQGMIKDTVRPLKIEEPSRLLKGSDVFLRMQSLNIVNMAVKDAQMSLIEESIGDPFSLDLEEMRQLNEDIRPLMMYTKYIYANNKNINKKELENELMSYSRRNKEYVAINLQNVTDSYYTTNAVPTYTQQDLYILEWYLTGQLKKKLSPATKTPLLILMFLLTVFGLMFISIKGAELTINQCQEWICLYFMCSALFAFIISPLKALIITYLTRNRDFT